MYKKKKHIHFMGIGGIGMSGIAEIIHKKGYTVSGCDTSSESKTLQRLRALGCTVYHGHGHSHIQAADVLVYSSAINKQEEEMVAAVRKEIPVIPRALMLAELMRTKHSIAITGAHGKTTTTSMIAHIFIQAGLDPTVVIGGILKNTSDHATLGTGNFLIAEADESDRSFLYLSPSVAVVTNIDAEHLDTYKDIEDIKDTFKNFLGRLPFYGKAVVCIDDPGIQAIMPIPHVPTIKYGLSPAADIRGSVISLAANHSYFQVHSMNAKVAPTGLLGTIMLSMAGAHNVLNALAAIALCLEFEISFETIQKALADFKGVERRFEFKGTYNGADVFDDYGHHPTEIKCTLAVAEKKKRNRLIVIFQPHRFTRTDKLWNEFIELFVNCTADEIYITDIYPASEQPIPSITSERLVAEIQSKQPAMMIKHINGFNVIAEHIKTRAMPGDLVITIGAGKINTVAEILTTPLSETK